MDYSQLRYPSYDTPLLQAYESRFSAAFIALHPFFRMPASVDWKATESPPFPDDIYIRQYGQPVAWQTIMEGIDCEDLRQFYIGMRTSIGALNREYEDKEMSRLIREYTEQANIYPPMEGRIEPLLVETISEYVSYGNTDKIYYLEEVKEEPKELSIEAVVQICDERWLRGSLFDANVTRLATVDWDDFFTVIYGSSDQLANLLENKPLEGFFCDNQTEHHWCWQSKPVKLAV